MAQHSNYHHKLLHNALARHTANMHIGENVNTAGSDTEDNEFTPVMTPEFSRATSPVPPLSSGGNNSSNNNRSSTPASSRSKTSTPVSKSAASASKPRFAPRVGSKVLDPSSKDPLRRFPNDITIRIFRCLSVTDLLTTVRVCKRWKRSATINWCFFRHFEHAAYEDELSDTEVEELGGRERVIQTVVSITPTWTRREAREDWRKRYISIVRRSDLQIRNAEEAAWASLGVDSKKTRQDYQREKWDAENAAVSTPSKADQREFYKSLANSKVKNKGSSGRASPRAPRDYGASDDDHI